MEQNGQFVGRRRRLRPSGISTAAQLIFGVGLIVMWVTADFFNGSPIALAIGGVAILAGIGLAFKGDKEDILRHSQSQTEHNPYNVWIGMGVMAILLGALGLILIMIDSRWDDTMWVMVEAGSLIIGSVLITVGTVLDKKRKQRT